MGAQVTKVDLRDLRSRKDPGGANAVYVAFAMLCVHVAWFEPPKAAGILGVGVCGCHFKKLKWESHILMGFELGVASCITHENIEGPVRGAL